jgi:O-antigen/teichoic acid export membrane protein
LAASFHRLSKTSMILVSPVVGVLVFAPREILLTWTGSETLAAEAGMALAIFSLGFLFNSTMQVPYALQLASGQEKIALIVNGSLLVLLAPGGYFLVDRFGITGGAGIWAIVGVVQLLFVPHFMDWKELHGSKWKWYYSDTLPFMLAGMVAFGTAAWVAHQLSIPVLVAMAGGFLLYLGMIYPFSGSVRKPLLKWIRHRNTMVPGSPSPSTGEKPDKI